MPAVQLAYARHLAQQAGCLGQITVQVTACDVCASLHVLHEEIP
jgi:hypothetical protein